MDVQDKSHGHNAADQHHNYTRILGQFHNQAETVDKLPPKVVNHWEEHDATGGIEQVLNDRWELIENANQEIEIVISGHKVWLVLWGQYSPAMFKINPLPTTKWGDQNSYIYVIIIADNEIFAHHGQIKLV